MRLLKYIYLNFPGSKNTVVMSNPGMVCFDENKYLFSVKTLELANIRDAQGKYHNPNIDTKIIPGNHSACVPAPDYPGENFMWNNWMPHEYYPNAQFNGTTQFYIFDPNAIKFQKIAIELDQKAPRISKSELYISGDARLTKLDNKYYIYRSDFRSIMQIDIQANKLIVVKAIFPSALKYPPDIPSINLTPIEISIDKKQGNIIKYIDWWYPYSELSDEEFEKKILESLSKEKEYWKENMKYVCKGLCIVVLEEGRPGLYVPDRLEIIKYDHGFSGSGSYLTDKQADKEKFKNHYGRLPGFSLGSSVFKLASCLGFKNCYVGCGHSKILTPEKYQYIPNSKVDIFRKNVQTKMKEKFGTKYKEHRGSTNPPDCLGYIYMMFFYILMEKNDGNWEMYLSDSYLPINLDNPEKWKFSLIFPMGICKKKDIILISAGEGDIYSILLSFPFKDVIKACRHNLQTISMDNYEFYYLLYKNGKSNMVQNL